MPIESILTPSPDNEKALSDAVESLTAECMSSHGLDYIPYPTGPDLHLFDPAQRYGAIAVDDAAQFGYRNPHATDLAQFDATIAAIDKRRESFGPSYNAVLYDGPNSFGTGAPVNSTGCYPLAQKQIFGVAGGISNIPGYTDVLAIQVDSNTAMYATAQAQSAMYAWSGCMKTVGYTFARWQDARAKFQSLADDTASPPADERSQAVADAHCRAQTKLEPVLFQVEDDLLKAKIDHNSQMIADFQSSVAASVGRAIAVLSAHAG